MWNGEDESADVRHSGNRHKVEDLACGSELGADFMQGTDISGKARESGNEDRQRQGREHRNAGAHDESPSSPEEEQSHDWYDKLELKNCKSDEKTCSQILPSFEAI